MRDEKQRFSLRKLSVGLTSVLIGIAFFEVGPKSSTVKADTITDNQSTQVVQTKANADMLNSKTSLTIDKLDTQIDAKVVTPANTRVDTQAVAQTGVNSASSNATPVANHDKQIGTQNAVKVSQQVEPQANAAFQDTQTAKQDAETMPTTLFLNNPTPAFSSNQLNENKVQSQVDDISKISDPSQISANHFAQGTRWTPAGWTRTPIGTKVAKSSKLTMGQASNINATDLNPVYVTNLNFTLDKNDIKKGNQILVGTIQQLPTTEKQNVTTYEDQPRLSTDSLDNMDIPETYKNQNLGHVVAKNLDNGEIDFWFEVASDIPDLATDPSFTNTMNGRFFTTNRHVTYSGFYGAKNNLQYPLHYSVINNSQITNYTISRPIFLPVDTNLKYNDNYFDTTWNQISYRYIDVSNQLIKEPNHSLGGGYVYKITTIAGQKPVSTKLWGTYSACAYIVGADGQPVNALTDLYLSWLHSNVKADNLTATDLWNQTKDEQLTVSAQNDGSVLVCFKPAKRFSNDVKSELISYTSNGAYANTGDPEHYQQIIDKTSKIVNASDNEFLLRLETPSTGSAYSITDLTPSGVNYTNIGTQLMTNTASDTSGVKLEQYKNVLVKYLDDDKNETQVSLDSLIGRQNKESTYTVNVPKGYYVNANNHDDGYKWSVDKKTISYTFDPDETKNQNHPIVIHLSHVKQTVNGDTSTQDTQLTTTHTRTIHFVYSDGSKASDDVAQAVVFTRTATRDMADGALSNFGNWTAHDDYSQVNVPVIHGYTPTQKIVAETNADPNHDVSVTVTYNKNVQQIIVSYIDDTTGKTLETKTLDGYSGDDTHYSTNESIEGYKQLGYELVSDSSKGVDLVLDRDDFVNNQAETVHLKHGLTTTNLEHDITRTIHYVYSDGHTAKPDNVLSLKFTGTETRDNVTKQITETKWNKESQNFPEIASPLISGYTANQTLISDMTVTPNSDNIVQTVTYNPNKQNIHVTFIDDTTGNTLNTVEKSGYTGDDSGYSTQNDIDSLVAKGYKLVSDDSPKENPTLHFDSDDFIDDQNITVHMANDTKESNLNR